MRVSSRYRFGQLDRDRDEPVIGHYPTPILRMSEISSRTCELWVKRDDLTNDLYGGNKIRKLERILDKAKARDVKRIVTIGAAGSHHVLATTLFGKRAGFRVAAVLTPQPKTAHVVGNLRAAMGLGLDAYPARSILDVPRIVAKLVGRGDMLVPPGGSNVTGTLGYVDGADEVAAAIREGELPIPDAIVVALGSGGTAAGILAGMVRHGLPTRVLGVRIVEPLLSGKARTLALSMAASRALGIPLEPRKLRTQFEVDGRWLGAGYGHPTEAGDRATLIAKNQGLVLDPTYTAKAFAAALDLVNRGTYGRVLYWHTLSAAPLAPWLENAPLEGDLDPELRMLFLDSSRP